MWLYAWFRNTSTTFSGSAWLVDLNEYKKDGWKDLKDGGQGSSCGPGSQFRILRKQGNDPITSDQVIADFCLVFIS